LALPEEFEKFSVRDFADDPRWHSGHDSSGSHILTNHGSATDHRFLANLNCWQDCRVTADATSTPKPRSDKRNRSVMATHGVVVGKHGSWPNENVIFNDAAGGHIDQCLNSAAGTNSHVVIDC